MKDYKPATKLRWHVKVQVFASGKGKDEWDILRERKTLETWKWNEVLS